MSDDVRIRNPWDASVPTYVIEIVNRLGLDDDTRGRFLHHVSRCSQCAAEIRSRRMVKSAGVNV